jgi:2'-5' RNA ligase/mRNA-degrading endonuclease RelE of RelBE toxin-antitoxin system
MTEHSATAFFRTAAHQPDEMMHVDDIARMHSEYGSDQHGNPITMGHVAQWSADDMANDRYEPEHLHALVHDVRQRGIEHPIHLWRKQDGTPYINDGTHRYWAAAKAGLSHVPVRWSPDYLSDEQGLDDHEGWKPSHTATAHFRKERNGADSTRTAGRGRPRRQPGAGDGAAGAGEDPAGAAPAVGADQGGAGPVGPRQVSFHPSAKKELLKLDGDSRKRVASTINALQRGDEGLQTHALTLKLKGWNSTKASRGHRVIHRDLDDGTLHIGYVGLHDYDKAINRLSSLTDYFRETGLQETASMDDDYRMQHRAPGPEHAPLHDPTRPNGDGGAFNQEGLDNPDWGEIGEPHEESLKAVHRAKGNPEAPVTIYRSVPHGTTSIRTGDWVSTSSQYALEHGMHSDDPSKDWPVLKATVPAKHVHTDGNDINEWGYNGPHIEHPAVHGPDDGWTEPTHHTAAVQATAAEQQFLQRQAAAVLHDEGVMVALVPPREVAEQLAREDGQPADQLHVTLAYLGNTTDYTREQLQLLPQVVGAWAARHKPVHVRIGGIGTFNNAFKGEHVLWAAADIPSGAQMHSSLAAYLEGHGYRLPSEHGWTPHLTLAYVGQHHRFMPRLDEHHWDAEEVVTFIGGTRHPARLFGRPSTPATL